MSKFRDMQEQGTFHDGREYERKILAKRITGLEAELEKHRWIPVSERLPRLEDACKGQGERGCRDGTVDVIGVDEYRNVFGANYFPKMNVWNFGTEPTHWKPIILPLKGESKCPQK